MCSSSVRHRITRWRIETKGSLLTFRTLGFLFFFFSHFRMRQKKRRAERMQFLLCPDWGKINGPNSKLRFLSRLMPFGSIVQQSPRRSIHYWQIQFMKSKSGMPFCFPQVVNKRWRERARDHLFSTLRTHCFSTFRRFPNWDVPYLQCFALDSSKPATYPQGGEDDRQETPAAKEEGETSFKP
jgi:hypothetical protein